MSEALTVAFTDPTRPDVKKLHLVEKTDGTCTEAVVDMTGDVDCAATPPTTVSEEQASHPDVFAIVSKQITDRITQRPVEKDLGEADRDYMNTASVYPVLSRFEEMVLFKTMLEAGLEAASDAQSESQRPQALARAESARELIILCNQRLVMKVAYRRQRAGINMSDLISEGNLGLFRAIERFDYRKGYKFSTYAFSWIKEFVGSYIEKTLPIVKLSKKTTQQIAMIHSSRRDLLDFLGREPETEEIAENLMISCEEVEALLKLEINSRCTSLDAPFDGNSPDTLIDKLPDPYDEITEKTDMMSDTELVRYALSRLDPHERQIIVGAFNIDGAGEITTLELSRALGVPRSTMMDQKKATLEALRTILEPLIDETYLK